jgi:hypothetical protein
MDKYEQILAAAEEKETTALDFSRAVEKTRLQDEVDAERKQDTTPVVGTAFSAGDMIRLFIYFDYYLNLKVDLGEFPNERLAKVYASIRKDVEAYSDNSLKFEGNHNPEYRKKQWCGGRAAC